MRTTTPSPFSMQQCIQKLVSFSPRQGASERAAAAYLCSVLKEKKISYILQKFTTRIPIVKSATLHCDGELINAEACSFVSGTIDDKHTIVSSAMPSRYCNDVPNISFNPSCKVLSPGNHYFAPALTVSHAGLKKVLQASSVKGDVRIRSEKHVSQNILVGNIKNPKAICFAHYDCIKKGAIDNASGVAVLLETIINNPDICRANLFVLAGNEELSYDRPTYWGHGFRIFEKKYSKQMKSAQSIITVDCVGNGKPLLLTDPGIVSRAFPLANSKVFASKTSLLTGDIDHLMTVYHSDVDDGRGITDAFLLQTVRALEKQLK